MSDYEGVSPESAVLATMLRHVTELRSALLRVQQDLEARAVRHDVSKFSPEEFPGFARINSTARKHPYGSEEYRAAIRAEKDTVDRHQRGNSHHPEYHEARVREDLRRTTSESPGPGLKWVVPVEIEGVDVMPWLDVIEMVCDWWAATQTYGTTPWKEVLEKQKARWNWSLEHWWLIGQVAAFLSGDAAPLPSRPVDTAELRRKELRELCGKIEDAYANTEPDDCGNYSILYGAWRALDRILSDWEGAHRG